MVRTHIRMGLVGGGFIGAHHIDAVRRLGDVEVIALAGSSQASADAKAKLWGIDRAYGHVENLLKDPDVQVVHNTTPNHLHFAITLAALGAGKHVISDKPLAMTSEECRLLRDAARSTGLANIVTFNYRGNPLVQKARAMIASGEPGRTVFVHGSYLQDWMTDETVYSWRSDQARGGPSSALADIGSHWCDLAEHISGERIQSVLADFATVVPVRMTSGEQCEAFTRGVPEPRARVEVHGEDVASVLLRFSNGAKGTFSVGQVLPGHKNDLTLEVCGRHLSLRWQQERQSELWVGASSEPNRILTQDLAAEDPDVRRYTRLPSGHQQGWSDAFANVIADAYEWVRRGGHIDSKPAPTATFEDGYRSACLVDAMIASHAGGNLWQPVQYAP